MPINAHQIPLIPGDGVGPELASAAHACFAALKRVEDVGVELVEYPAGYSSFRETGDELPNATLDAMRRAPASLLTAVSVSECPAPSIMGRIRQHLSLFADIRHCLSDQHSLRAGVDLVMFRECSEGFLADRNMYRGSGQFMPTPDVALSVRVTTREKCEQIAKLAFEYAESHGRKRITVAHKEVVFSLGCGLFRECVRAEAARHPAIALEEELVDELAGHLVSEPERYEMILTTNLFGDILADVAAAQVGSMVPVINASESTSFFCAFHTPHYGLAGKQKVNPIGMIRTLSAMLHWLECKNAGFVLDRALEECSREAWSRTVKLPSGLTTSAVTQSIVQSIRGEAPRAASGGAGRTQR